MKGSMGDNNLLNNMKIIIIGAMGMLGRELVEVFADYSPIAWDIVNIDITNQKQVLKKISQENPDLVVNAAAYTDVDCSEKETELANKVNGNGVGNLALACRQVGAVLVHISTDYVFDGTKKQGYLENDKPNPINAYGRSKLLGEKLLRENHDKYYLIRTSWMFGKHGEKNFVRKIIRAAKYKETLPPLKKLIYKLAGKHNLRVVNDHFGKPTYAKDLAERIKEIVKWSNPYGIYHVTNETPSGGITWFDLAKKAVELIRAKVKVVPCSASEFPQPAKRPKYSILINTKLPKMRDWQEALSEYLRQLA
jgi:dTDP-4-dehydrorhamnose reductase